MEQDQVRKKLMARAHVLKAQIGMSDADFDRLKTEETGIGHLRLMDLVHLRAFVAAMDRLSSSPEAPAATRRLSDGQYRKIIKLSRYILCWSDKQTDSFIEKETGKHSLKWLTAREAFNLTEALSAIIERSSSHAVKARYRTSTRHHRKDG